MIVFRKRLSVVLTLSLALLFTGCGGKVTPAPAAPPSPPPTGAAPLGKAADPERPAPNFVLTDQNGQPFKLSDQKGKVVALYFGYTHCPDVCPLTSGMLANASQKLGEDAKDVRFVFVTADPGRDTPARLQEFMGRFRWAPGVTVYALTGTEQELAPVWAAYDVGAEKGPVQADGNYAMQHTARVWLIDRSSQLRLYHLLGTTSDAFTNDFRWLLRN